MCKNMTPVRWTEPIPLSPLKQKDNHRKKSAPRARTPGRAGEEARALPGRGAGCTQLTDLPHAPHISRQEQPWARPCPRQARPRLRQRPPAQRAAGSPRNSRASRRNTRESRPVGSSVSLNKHFLRVSLCQAQSWGLFPGCAGSRAVVLTPRQSCPSPQHHPSNGQEAKRRGRITRNAGRITRNSGRITRNAERRKPTSTRPGENRQRPSNLHAHLLTRLSGSFPRRRPGAGPKALRFSPTPRRGCRRSEDPTCRSARLTWSSG